MWQYRLRYSNSNVGSTVQPFHHAFCLTSWQWQGGVPDLCGATFDIWKCQVHCFLVIAFNHLEPHRSKVIVASQTSALEMDIISLVCGKGGYMCIKPSSEFGNIIYISNLALWQACPKACGRVLHPAPPTPPKTHITVTFTVPKNHGIENGPLNIMASWKG